jgi:hypothetical protein
MIEKLAMMCDCDNEDNFQRSGFIITGAIHWTEDKEEEQTATEKERWR